MASRNIPAMIIATFANNSTATGVLAIEIILSAIISITPKIADAMENWVAKVTTNITTAEVITAPTNAS